MINSVPLEDELKKNPIMEKSDVRQLRLWSDRKPNLSRLGDSDLALFLHNNFYNVDEAKKNIESYYKMRFLVPEFFGRRDPINNDRLTNIFNTVTILPLKQLTKEGYKVILAKLIDVNPDNYVFNDAVKFMNMVLDLCVYEDGTNNGYVFVFDITGTTLRHCLKLSWFSLKKFFDYTKSGSPIRWKGLHYVNSSLFGGSVQDFIKTKILGKNFADKIYLHKNFEKFSEVIPIEILPFEMGGKAGLLMDLHKEQIKKLQSYERWFSYIDSFVMAGERNELKQLNVTDVFGENVELKNLEID